MKYQVHCGFPSCLKEKKKERKKKHPLSLIGFSLACQAGIKISLKTSFAWSCVRPT